MAYENCSRRRMLRNAGAGFGMLAFAGLNGSDALKAAPVPKAGDLWSPKPPHFAPKAKNVIFVFLRGGLSQVDTFDPKPMLDKYDGKPLPYDAPRTEFTTGNLMRSPFSFKRYGQSGAAVSEIFPKIAGVIDDFCQVRSMITDIPNHGPAIQQTYTGAIRPGRPSMGSWVIYGLGTENQNLPGFLSLAQGASEAGTSAGFLPATFQGTAIPFNEVDPRKQIQSFANPKLGLPQQQRQLDLWKDLAQNYMNELQTSPEMEATIHSMEVAFRMQTEAPDIFDIRKESATTLAGYGEGNFARGCIMARRMVEHGVRFVQLYHGNWDHHTDIMGHKVLARDVDQPIAALVSDLESRGMLNETLVVVGSEFGRTPVLDIGSFRALANGRDHNPYGYTTLLAGGGVKAGMTYGATDDFGFKATENPVHVHDLHATMLHLLGLDHERLTYRYSGRDFRLTDVAGNVVKDILA